jgi:hypothetical protein
MKILFLPRPSPMWSPNLPNLFPRIPKPQWHPFQPPYCLEMHGKTLKIGMVTSLEKHGRTLSTGVVPLLEKHGKTLSTGVILRLPIAKTAMAMMLMKIRSLLPTEMHGKILILLNLEPLQPLNRLPREELPSGRRKSLKKKP